MTLRSLKTNWLPTTELSLYIKRPKAYASVFPSNLQLICLITGMDTKLVRDSLRNAIKNARSWFDLTHSCWISVPYGSHTFISSFSRSTISLLASYIHKFRPDIGILHLTLVYNAIVTDLKLIMSSNLLSAMFSLYLKLFRVPSSLLFEPCSLINVVLNVVILLSIFMKIVYKIVMIR